MIASPSEEEVQSFHEVQRDFEGTILRWFYTAVAAPIGTGESL